MSSHTAPTRTLPRRPSLAQLRKQAKDLFHSYRAGHEGAVAEVKRFERRPDPAKFALADAQRVLARAYGFASWPALKNHLEGVNFAALLAAAEAGDVAAVRRLAAARPSLLNRRVAEFRDSALHRAVLHRNAELTRLLMQLGADARTGIWPRREATSAYAIAVDREYREIAAAIEHEEDNRRARLSHAGASRGTSVEALQREIAAGRGAEAIARMEADPALIEACDIYGVTALHVAAWKHDAALVGWLLDHGASPGALALCADPVQRDTTETGKTPLDFAAIVAGWAPEGFDGSCYFMENARVDPARFHATLGLLLQRGAELTPAAAVALGDHAGVIELDRAGRLLNEIHLFRGGLLAIAVRVNRIDMVAALLDLGFDPDESVSTDDGARSWGMPLWFASMCGRQEIAELLLSRGADVNAVVYACGESLGMAADEKMVKLLRQHGAQLAVEHVTDLEAAQAILNGKMQAYSLNVDEATLNDLAEQMMCRGEPEFVRMCLPFVARTRDDPWWNHVLASMTSPVAFKLILEHGVNPDVRDAEGYATLHHLASDWCPAESRLLRATMLLDAGASLTIRDPLLRSTPLGWACRYGRIDLVQLYLQRGADVSEPDAEAWATPLAWALKRGHREIVQLLRSRGIG